MNLVADEGIDEPIVERLRAEGHRVLYIAESNPAVTDEEVLDTANKLGAVLITSDKDFGELVFRQKRIMRGVILIRLAGLTASAKAHLVAAALREYGEKMEEAFCVISPGAVRVRRR